MMTETTASPAPVAAPAPTPLVDFFSAAEARFDRWRQLSAVVRGWQAAPAREGAGDALFAEAVVLFAEVAALEAFFAYPGPHLMAATEQALSERNAGVAVRLIQHISDALLSGAYRHDSGAWDPLRDESAARGTDLSPDMHNGNGQKPYFEALVVTPTDPAHWERARHDLKRLRRPDDAFTYEIVQVGTFEDAVLGTICNFNLQAVIIRDGFEFRSRHDVPVLRDFLRRHLNGLEATTAPGALALALARAVKRYRPELDIYLLTDRGVEALAGSEEAAPLRRIFHNVEEVMELHLALLDGVNDRYETPYFNNLKKYAQRPIGTFHALPIARGKSVFRSNWIRDMGHFYGTNLFLAESSATSGGLDSLLEPTGTIKKAQDLTARAFGAPRAYFATNGTSTSNKIVVQAICTPGDIVIVDRNCHKSHHYGLVLAGAQPYYVEAYPLLSYSMYGGVPLMAIKAALLNCLAQGTLDRVRAIDLTNCTFDGHMYNTVRVMQECLAIKPDLIFLWDEAWFGFARFNAFHRRRTAMGAAAALSARFRDPAYRAEYQQAAAAAGPIDAEQPAAAHHTTAARSRQGAHPRLPDVLDAQVDVGAAAGLDDPDLGRRFSSRRELVHGSVLHAYVHLAESPDHRVARRRAPADGARRVRADDARRRDRVPHPAGSERPPAGLALLPHHHAGRDGAAGVPGLGHLRLRPSALYVEGPAGRLGRG